MEKLGPRVRVRTAQPLRGFTVLITFENGVQREINLEPYLHGPIFEPIRNNPSMFSSIKIEGGTIAWYSGTIAWYNGADIDPDVLYYNLRPAWMEDPDAVPAKGSNLSSG